MIEYQVTEHRTEKYVARIHKPILTEDERKKREEEIKAVLVQYGREKLRGANKNV